MIREVLDSLWGRGGEVEVEGRHRVVGKKEQDCVSPVK